MKHILCYGDSNTWGFVPGSGARYDEHTRWTGVLQDLLGIGWRIHEDGLNARMSVFDWPFKPFLNGLQSLPATLVSQKPLDAVVLSLGTNDLKVADAARAAEGVACLIHTLRSFDLLYPAGTPVFTHGPKILVISPIAVAQNVAEINPTSDLKGRGDESRLFADRFRRMCAAEGVEMIDGAALAEPSPTDGIHMTADGHRALAEAVAKKLREMV